MMNAKDRLDLLERAQKVLAAYLPSAHPGVDGKPCGDRISESLRRLIHVCSDCLAVNCMGAAAAVESGTMSMADAARVAAENDELAVLRSLNILHRPGLRIMAKEDGVWLELVARNGKQCLINLSAEARGPIVRDCLMDVARAGESGNTPHAASEFLKKRFPDHDEDAVFTIRDVFLIMQAYAESIGAGRT